jgi:predicted ArsR family transcriptional regulator
MGRGLVERRLTRTGRGRPSHRYSLTEQGLRSTGSNYGDLAVALWEEIRAVKDVQVRRGLLKRIADRLVSACGERVRGSSLAERMTSLGRFFAERQVPLAVDDSGKLPVLTALACPYPDLAEQDRSVCAMERMMFSELLGEGLKLTACRLDGATCCTFEVD